MIGSIRTLCRCPKERLDGESLNLLRNERVNYVLNTISTELWITEASMMMTIPIHIGSGSPQKCDLQGLGSAINFKSRLAKL